MGAVVQNRRVWQLGGLLAAVLLIAASWLLLISPQLDDATSSRADAAATRTSNDQLSAHVGVLRRQSAQVSKYRAQLQQALAALPPDSGLPALTRQLTAQANTTHVTLDGIIVSPTDAAPAATTPSSSTSSGATPPSSGTPPTTTSSSLSTLQISLTSSGKMTQQLAFLHALQYLGARRVLVSSTAFTPAGGSEVASLDGECKLTTQLTVFTAPLSSDQLAQLHKLLSTSGS